MNLPVYLTSGQGIWLGLAIVAALAGFYLSFRWMARARIIEDTPTAVIRSAQQGYLELNGQAQLIDGPPIVAPLTSTPCCWYQYKIEKKGDKHWRTLESDTSDELFLLEDETGHCIIDPEGAEVTPSQRSVWYGQSRYPQERSPASQRVQPTSLLKIANLLITNIGIGGRYRYTEERIFAGDALYALGQFKTRDELDQRIDQQELTRHLLQQWKRDKSQLLKQFDLNQDGQIDQKEWELVRKAAARKAELELTQHSETGLHRLTAPDADTRPYLLSTLPQFDLVRRYRFQALGGIILFFLSGAAAIWLWNTPQVSKPYHQPERADG